MIFIAHAIKTLKEAKKATAFGCSLLEVDVSQNILNGKFLVQHHGLKGKLGIGSSLSDILKSPFANRLVLDLKHAKYSLNYLGKFNKFIKWEKVGNLKITGIDLKIISGIARKNNAEVYYGFLNKKSTLSFQKNASMLYKPSGFSIRKNLIDQKLIRSLKSNYPKSEIWAWTVNDKEEIGRLKNLGVDGIITDLWKS